MAEKIDIKGIDKAEILAALFNASHQQGLGILDFRGSAENRLTVEEARDLIAGLEKQGHHITFDYLRGRVMKVDLSSNTLDPRLYDRDNGEGAAEAALLEVLTRPKGR